jgi:hypothetical protein
VNTRAKDIALIQKALGYEIPVRARSDFEDMAEKLADTTRLDYQSMLSAKQRSYVSDVLDKFEPQYSNDVSAGRVPLGKPVMTPDVLRHLPLKPPGYRRNF